MLRKVRPLLFVHKLVSQDNDRDGQRNDATGLWPRVDSAQQKVSGKKPADKEKKRCNDEADDLGKSHMPNCAFGIGMCVRSHVPTAVSTGWLGGGTLASKQDLQMRGRRLRNETAPFAKQL